MKQTTPPDAKRGAPQQATKRSASRVERASESEPMVRPPTRKTSRPRAARGRTRPPVGAAFSWDPGSLGAGILRRVARDGERSPLPEEVEALFDSGQHRGLVVSLDLHRVDVEPLLLRERREELA